MMAVSTSFLFSHHLFVNKAVWYYDRCNKERQNVRKASQHRESREASVHHDMCQVRTPDLHLCRDWHCSELLQSSAWLVFIKCSQMSVCNYYFSLWEQIKQWFCLPCAAIDPPLLNVTVFDDDMLILTLTPPLRKPDCMTFEVCHSRCNLHKVSCEI